MKISDELAAYLDLRTATKRPNERQKDPRNIAGLFILDLMKDDIQSDAPTRHSVDLQ
jgi:hypothetical protein